LLSIKSLQKEYFTITTDNDFALGNRSNLTYAAPCYFAHLSKLNESGPEPYQYLEFAKADIMSSDERGAINALGNAKRAVHLTIESFLKILGIEKQFKKANFPNKLNIIKKIEAFPTKTLEILNKERNLVEHEYSTIDSDEVIKFIDITEMFLMLAYPFFKNTVIGANIGLQNDDRCIRWFFDIRKGRIYIYELSKFKTLDTKQGKIHYNISGDKKDEKIINEISVKSKNIDEWLSYVNLFVYCTKKIITKLPIDDTFNEDHKILYITQSTNEIMV